MSTVTIRYHDEPAGWWAESEEIPGWTAVGSTFLEVRELALAAVEKFVGQTAVVVEEGAPPGVRIIRNA